MDHSSHNEPDYAFGQTMLTLRSTLRLTQAALAELLGVSRRAIVTWETGVQYPTADHLKKLIAFTVQQGAFPVGHEDEAIRSLWRASRQKLLLDEAWLASLLRQVPDDGRRTTDNRPPERSSSSIPAGPRLDWGDALSVSNFYDRVWELDMLAQWTVQERCRVVSVLGLGGIGKSALAVNLMHHVASQFDVVIWRSLRDAPSIEVLLDDCLQVVAPQALAAGDSREPLFTERRLNALLDHMRHTRILLVLDNLETLFEEGAGGHPVGVMREGYDGFGRLLHLVAETEHRSCLLFTSREKPAELVPYEGNRSPVRTLRLPGLEAMACDALLTDKEVKGSAPERAGLIKAYAANPLALKIVAQTIVDLFDGDPGLFLEQGGVIFGGVRNFLAEQFNRLSALEQRIMIWLAILREPASLKELQAVMVTPISPVQLLEALEALHRRSLVERSNQPGSFTLQSVVLEYVISRLITDVSHEIEQDLLDLVIEYSLEQAQAPDYVRQTQERLIGQPILQRLVAIDGMGGAETRLLGLLERWRGRPREEQGYAPGNAVNLLRLLRGNLRGIDLSNLSIRQAYLQGVEVQDASLAGTQLSEAVLGEAFTYPNSVALSADGAFLVAGTSTGEVRLWRAADRTPLLVMQGHTGFVYCLAVSDDGQLLASAGDDGLIQLWEASSGRLLATLQGHAGAVYGVALSGDGELLASSGLDGTVRLWETESGRLLATLSGGAGAVHRVALSRDGKLLATGGFDGTVRLWETESGQALTTLQGHAGAVYSVALSRDGKLLATGGFDGTVRLWETGSRQALTTLQGHTGAVVDLALSGNGELLASAGLDRTVRIWEAPSGRLLAALPGHSGAVYGVALSGDGRLLASGSDDRTVRLWETSSGRGLATLQGNTGGVWGVALSGDGKLLASGSLSGTVRLWETGSGSLLTTLEGHSGAVRSVALSGDGMLLASGSDDQTARLWEASSGRLIATLQGHSGTIRGVALSGDGKLLASASWDETVRLWEVRSGRLLATLQGHTGAVWCVVLSGDGRLLASGGLDGTVRLWETGSGSLLATLQQGHTGTVSSVAFSGDGELLVSGNQAGTINLWEVSSRRLLTTLEEHHSAVYSVALSAQGQLLASGSVDGTLRLWEVPGGRPLGTLEGNSSAIWGVALSGDGKLLASGSTDGTLRLWDTGTGTLLRVLRADRRYERVNITGLTGVNEAQKRVLRTLGAVERGT